MKKLITTVHTDVKYFIFSTFRISSQNQLNSKSFFDLLFQHWHLSYFLYATSTIYCFVLKMYISMFYTAQVIATNKTVLSFSFVSQHVSIKQGNLTPALAWHWPAKGVSRKKINFSLSFINLWNLVIHFEKVNSNLTQKHKI